MDTTTVYLPRDLHRALKSVAATTGRSQAELIREAITIFAAGHERPWPRTIGIVSSGWVQAAELEDWLNENRSRDW